MSQMSFLNFPFLITLITLTLLSISFIISKLHIKNKMIDSPFECGFNPFNPARLPFSIQFFFISILFLIFDIEIILILPFPLISTKTPLLIMALLSTFSILILSLIYEWSTKTLKWL